MAWGMRKGFPVVRFCFEQDVRSSLNGRYRFLRGASVYLQWSSLLPESSWAYAGHWPAFHERPGTLTSIPRAYWNVQERARTFTSAPLTLMNIPSRRFHELIGMLVSILIRSWTFLDTDQCSINVPERSKFKNVPGEHSVNFHERSWTLKWPININGGIGIQLPDTYIKADRNKLASYLKGPFRFIRSFCNRYVSSFPESGKDMMGVR